MLIDISPKSLEQKKVRRTLGGGGGGQSDTFPPFSTQFGRLKLYLAHIMIELLLFF